MEELCRRDACRPRPSSPGSGRASARLLRRLRVRAASRSVASGEVFERRYRRLTPLPTPPRRVQERGHRGPPARGEADVHRRYRKVRAARAIPPYMGTSAPALRRAPSSRLSPRASAHVPDAAAPPGARWSCGCWGRCRARRPQLPWPPPYTRTSSAAARAARAASSAGACRRRCGKPPWCGGGRDSPSPAPSRRRFTPADLPRCAQAVRGPLRAVRVGRRPAAAALGGELRRLGERGARAPGRLLRRRPLRLAAPRRQRRGGHGRGRGHAAASQRTCHAFGGAQGAASQLSTRLAQL